MLLLLAAGCRQEARPTSTVQPSEASLRGMALKETRPAHDFTLTDHHGQPVHLHDMQGKVIALFFGYTRCPDICPLTMSVMSQAAAALGTDAEHVRFLFVTVDPERDSAPVLAKYLSHWEQVNVTGLTGSEDQLAPVYAEYQVTIEKVPRENGAYAVNHSALTWLIDQSGTIRAHLPMGATGEDLANDIRYLLKHPQKPAAQIRDAWVRPADAGAATAAYFTITNPTNAPIILKGVQTDWGEGSLHQTVVENGGAMTKMKHVATLEIPANGQVAFKPGGYHVMIENLKRALRPGEDVALTFRLGDGTSLTVTAVVQD
ncbi:MAG: hypothetical protein K0R39_4105 [Symbiobacteriaceae bacterium]|nr:hypothetical protein [Symbiobacteriaceae bacterium]